MEEIEKPLEEYENFNAFFTRKLKEGSRNLKADGAQFSIVSRS
jgi:phosphatidylserine decarboxylase